MPERRWPGGVTPRPRSGAAAESARLRRRRNSREELPKSEVRDDGREELPHIRGQGRQPRGATLRPKSGAVAEKRYPRTRSGTVASREELPHAPTPEARGGSREELPYARGQGRRPGGPTPPAGGQRRPPGGPTPLRGGCAGAERAAVRRYPSSKVRSSGCALQKQP